MKIQDLPLDIQYNILYYLCEDFDINKTIRLCTIFHRSEEHSTWIQKTFKSYNYMDLKHAKMNVHLSIIASNMNIKEVMSYLIHEVSYTRNKTVFTDALVSKITTMLINNEIADIRSDILKRIFQQEGIDLSVIVDKVLKSGVIDYIKYIPLKYFKDIDVLDYINDPYWIDNLKIILWYQLPSKSLKLEEEHYKQLTKHYSISQATLSRLSKNPSFDVEVFKKLYKPKEQSKSVRYMYISGKLYMNGKK